MVAAHVVEEPTSSAAAAHATNHPMILCLRVSRVLNNISHQPWGTCGFKYDVGIPFMSRLCGGPRGSLEGTDGDVARRSVLHDAEICIMFDISGRGLLHCRVHCRVHYILCSM